MFHATVIFLKMHLGKHVTIFYSSRFLRAPFSLPETFLTPFFTWLILNIKTNVVNSFMYHQHCTKCLTFIIFLILTITLWRRGLALQMRKLRFREVRQFVQGYPASKLVELGFEPKKSNSGTHVLNHWNVLPHEDSAQLSPLPGIFPCCPYLWVHLLCSHKAHAHAYLHYGTCHSLLQACVCLLLPFFPLSCELPEGRKDSLHPWILNPEHSARYSVGAW